MFLPQMVRSSTHCMPKSFAATEQAWSKSSEISLVMTLSLKGEFIWAKARIGVANAAAAQLAVARNSRRVGFIVSRCRTRRSDGAADEQDAIVEGRRLALVKGEVQGWPLGLEPVRAQRVDGKKAIVAGVPVGWVVGVSGVVEDRNGFSLAVGGGARELAPLAARAPGIIADLAFAGAVDAGGAGGGSCDGGCYAVGIAEGLGLCGGRLEKVGDADAEQPVFVGGESGGFEGLERDRHGDGPGWLAVDGELREDVARGLMEDGRLLVASDRWDVGGGVPGGLG